MLIFIYLGLKVQLVIAREINHVNSICIKLVILCLCTLTRSSEVMVQVDVQNAQQAGFLHEALDEISESDMNSFGLGAIEATMSKFIPDTNLDEVIVAIPPTLEIITDISFDEQTSVWSLGYNTMGSPYAQESDEHYVRIVYMTKNGNSIDIGDGNNECLLPETTHEACMTILKNDYILPKTLVSESTRPEEDHLVFSDGGILSTHTIPAASSPSIVQELDIEIEHARIVGTKSGEIGLSNKHSQIDESSGSTLEIYQFGIGVIFWPNVGSRTIIFDKFELVKNAMGSWSVEKSHQYTIVRHIQFQIVQPAADRIEALGNNRLIKLETMIESGHALHSVDPIKVSIRHGPLDSDFTEISGIFLSGGSLIAGTDCEGFQAGYDAANVENCLSSVPLCEIQQTDFTTIGGSSKLISVNTPLISTISPFNDFFDIQTTIKTINSGGVTLYSILNFKLFHTSITSKCNAVVRQTFSPIDYIEVNVYGKKNENELELYETCTGGQCAMTNIDIRTLSTIQALNTIFLGLRDDSSASADAITFQKSLVYMQSSSDQIYLDDLYISHKLFENPYTFVDGDVSVSIDDGGSANGRSRISLETQLTDECPEQTLQTSSAATCVTTHDYLHGTVIVRPLTPAQTYVYERKFLGSSLFDEDALFEGQSVRVSDFIPYYIYIPNTCDDISTMTCLNYELEGSPRRVSGSSDWKQCYLQFTTNVNLDVSCSGTSYTIEVILDNTAADQDQNFLKTIYGESVSAHTFMEAVVKIREDPRYVKSFWVSPIYHWPVNPIGLNDVTAIHMSWSIGSHTSSASSRRRLLSNLNADIKNKTLNSSFGIETFSEFNPIISTKKPFSTPQPDAMQITEVYDYQEDYAHSMAIEENIALACKKFPDYRNFPYAKLKEQINPASICAFENENICKDLLELDTSLKLDTLLMIIETSDKKHMVDIEVSNNTNKMCKKVIGNSEILQLEFDKTVPSPINLWIQYLNGTEVCNLQYLVDLYKQEYSLVQVENNIATFLSKKTLKEYNIQDIQPECFQMERKNINLLYLYEQASHFLLSYAVFSWIRHDLVKESMRLRVGCNNEFTSFQFMHGNSHKLIKM